MLWLSPSDAFAAETNSVATFVLKTQRAASDPFVLSKLANAEAVFFAGGDQV